MEHYHRTWAEINLNAIERNVLAAKAHLPCGTKLCAVIKADGYGHGAELLAKFLDDKTDFYAVAVLEEALTLRAAGVLKPILLLGYSAPEQAHSVVDANLAATVFTMEMAQALSAAAVAQGKQAKLHVAVDTGMTRVGFADTRESAAIVAQIAKLPNVLLEGLYSHFACADEADKTSAQSQLERFKAFSAMLDDLGVSVPIKHICNSAGIMEFGADYKFDMVRLGISLYGLYPSNAVEKENMPLQPAMAWKTRVVFIKTVPPHVGVSYGHTFITERVTKIATLPIGYADGYPRALSNQGHVLIHGKCAPILGRVCMDQCMVDVTDIPDVVLGDEVVLIGKQGESAVTMEEIGAMCASFNYETACRVGQRVPRLYIYNSACYGFHSVFLTEAGYAAKE
jgi:alanine racemase